MAALLALTAAVKLDSGEFSLSSRAA